MAIDKRHPKSTDMNDISLKDSTDLTQQELEALQDKYGTGKTAN